jgi:hypothetical protein
VSSAAKLLEKIRRSKNGWGQADLHKVYIGHGFQCRKGSKHLVYWHPEFPDLRATVARHNSLPVGYFETAIEKIDEAAQRKADNEARKKSNEADPNDSGKGKTKRD